MTTLTPKTILEDLFGDKEGKLVSIAYPSISQAATFTINKRSKITGTISVKIGTTFHKIKTYDVSMCLFMAKHVTNKEDARLDLVIGNERIQAYNNVDNYAQASVTITPLLLYNANKTTTIDDEKTLFNTFEMLKYIINNFPDESKITKCELTEEELHAACKSVYEEIGKFKDNFLFTFLTTFKST